MSENWNVVINLCSVSLCDALGNPDHVPTLLFLETNVRVERSKMKLLHEGQHVDLNLEREEKWREER